MATFDTQIEIKAVDKASHAIKHVAGSLKALQDNARRVSQNFSEFSNASREFGAKMRNIALLATGAGVAVFGLIKKQGELGENLLNSAQKAGITVEQLQKLRYAAELSGVSAEEMDNSLKFLNRSLADAATNSNSDAAKAFQSMGIAVKDSAGNVRNANDVMLEMADVFKKNQDGATKVNTAMTTMGRAGTTLIPVLNQGNQLLKKQGEELEKLGGIMSKDMAEKADAVGDNLQRLGFIFRGLSITVASSLMPAINDVVVQFMRYYTANKQIIQTNINQFIRNVISGFKDVARTLRTVYLAIAPVIEKLGGIKMIIQALAGIYIGSLIVSFGKLIISLSGVIAAIARFSIVLLATPVGWFMLAIAAITGAVYAIYKHWEPISNFFKNLWEKVKAAFASSEAAEKTVQQFAQNTVGSLGLIADVIWLIIKAYNALKAVFSGNVPTPKIALPPALNHTRFQPATLNPADNSDTISNQPARPTLIGRNFVPAFAQSSAPAVIPQSSAFASSPAISAPIAAVNSSPFMSATKLTPAIQKPQTQRLDITMKIDAEGRAKDVKAKSNAPIDFKANTGVLIP